jgi:para-nitrobenzyl esterase
MLGLDRLLGALLASALLSTTVHAADATPALRRSTSLGVVIGSDESARNGSYVWKGIPFAKPPVGELRWRPPADLDPWREPLSTQQFGPACASSGRLYGPGFNNRYDATIGESLDKTVGSEDCLYLNIWRPATAAERLPVIVFVHGGSNITGYTADPVYDGAALAKLADAVVVTVNYRLGVLGFFNLPQLRDGDPQQDSGNFALLDLIHALRFLQREIAAFGGDPGRITLMGESAGAVNVYALLSSPLVATAKPALAHRVVAMSGGISRAEDLPPRSLPVVQPVERSEAQAMALLTQLLIADGRARDAATARSYVDAHKPDEIAAYLRGKSADALLSTVIAKLRPIGMSGSGPIPDGHVLPRSPIGAIRSGQYLKVPVLAGNTRDESKLFPALLALSPALGGISGRLLSDAEVFDIAYRYDPDAAPASKLEQWIPAAYLPTDKPETGYSARTRALDSVWFMPLRDSVLGALRSQQEEVWYYRFDWAQQPAPFNEIFGAAHAFDLPFVFGNFGPSLWANFIAGKANEPGRLALADAMMRALAAFARAGDPNTPALGTTWPHWPRTLVFDASPKTKAIRTE